MILVTVGTEQYPFNALMNWIDALIRHGLIAHDEEVVVQYGSSSKLPDRVKVFKRLPESEFRALLEQARVVISHCGEGSVMLLESLGKPYILVPRTQRFGEHVDDHQVEMADAMEKQGISVARSPGDLVRFLAAPKFSGLMPHSEDELCDFLSDRYDPKTYKKIMVVSSSGGHFKYAQSLEPFLEKFENVCWVTFKTLTTQSKLETEKSVYWAYSPTNRNLPNLIRNLLLAFKVLKHEQPDVVLSTGAGIAVPFLFLAQFLYKKKTVFVESKTRLKTLSLSAKILYYVARLDQLIVRSKKVANKYQKTTYIGNSTVASAQCNDNQKPSRPMKVNETAILSTPSHFSVLEAPQFKQDFQALCALEPKKVVIDMSATVFITSMGLGALVSSFKECKARGIELVLWSVHPDVKSVFSMTKLDEVFKIEPSTAAVRSQDDKKTKQNVEPETNALHKQVQRAIDIAIGFVGLGITAALFIPISIGIKLDSPGPIFSEEVRYGLMGKFFLMRKFRTTVAKSNAIYNATPEITKFGDFLRKSNLDKLPLFWNLLIGHMSLVGPQASTIEDVDSYATTGWKSLEFKPGMFNEWEFPQEEGLPKKATESNAAASGSVASINSTKNQSRAA